MQFRLRYYKVSGCEGSRAGKAAGRSGAAGCDGGAGSGLCGELQCELPGAEVSLPSDFDALVEIMNKQDGSYADVEQYFALQANKTSRDLHLLFPVHHDEAGWFSSYLSQWMANVGALGVDAPYLDQLGAMPEAPNFGAQWGDGGGGARVYDLVKQGGAAAEAYSRQNDSWGFSYELYTDVWSQAGGISLLSGHRIIPCSAMCSQC